MHDTKTKGRYAKLRPHRDILLQWCLEGRQWVEMAKMLEAEHGLKVTPSSINNLCTREGYVHVHEYSNHYQPRLKEMLLNGTITSNALKQNL